MGDDLPNWPSEGQVHGKAVKKIFDDKSKEPSQYIRDGCVFSGFAVKNGQTLFNSGALNVLGMNQSPGFSSPYQDGAREMNSVEMNFISNVVDKWKATGPGHTHQC